MATRKFINNRVEVVDSSGQTFITPRIIFGYAKIDNFAQVYNCNALVLTPTGNEKVTGFVSGDRALFYLGVVVESAVIAVTIGGTQYTLKDSGGADVQELDVGWHAICFNGTTFVLDEFDLDEKDYVYCDNIINGCIAVAEKYMTYDIIPKQYREFRNDLGGDYLEVDRLYDGIEGAIFNLRRGVTATGLQITYTTSDGETATVPNDEWYLAGNKLVVTGSYYPTADKLECVTIKYNVANTIEPDLYAALLQHISEAYEGRGLCTSTACPAALGMGNGVLAVYNTYRIPRIGA